MFYQRLDRSFPKTQCRYKGISSRLSSDPYDLYSYKHVHYIKWKCSAFWGYLLATLSSTM